MTSHSLGARVVPTRMRYYVSLDPSAQATPMHVDVSELPTGQLEVTLPLRIAPIPREVAELLPTVTDDE